MTVTGTTIDAIDLPANHNYKEDWWATELSAHESQSIGLLFKFVVVEVLINQ